MSRRCAQFSASAFTATSERSSSSRYSHTVAKPPTPRRSTRRRRPRRSGRDTLGIVPHGRSAEPDGSDVADETGGGDRISRRSPSGRPPATARRSTRCWPRSSRGCSASAGGCCSTPRTPRRPRRTRCCWSPPRSAASPGRSKFTTWLHAVTSNSARSTYRSLKRRSAERTTDELPTHADPRTTSVIAGSRLDLLDALDVIGVTHPGLVEALVLRDIQELEYADIAAAARRPARHREVADPPGAAGRSGRCSRSPTDQGQQGARRGAQHEREGEPVTPSVPHTGWDAGRPSVVRSTTTSPWVP